MELNKSRIYIDGKEVLAGATYQVEIIQTMGKHNRFTISFPTSSGEGFGASLMDGSIQYVGKGISISYKDSLEFVGLVSHVQLQKKNAASGTIFISGFSSDILLSKRYDCMSFDEGFTLQDVISEAIKDHSNESLKIQYGHKMGTTLPYTVQYNESDYDFVHRMCSRYGKWLYNNGTELCIGRIGEKKVTGIYGDQIHSFGLQGGIQEQSFSIHQHDWVNNSPLEEESSVAKPLAKHPYIKTIKQNSDALYNVKGYYHYVHGMPEYSNQQGVNEATKAHTLARTANMIIAKGTGNLHHLRLGDTLKVQSFNYMDILKKESYGSYMITHIIHHFNSSGEYSNAFEGVPEGTEYPNYGNPFSYARIETQRAIVKYNNDPEGLGRVKVQFPWQKKNGDRTTPWIKMATPYAGNDKGFYFIPEVEEEVLIGFEGANAERPFVLSAGFNKTANSSFADPDNNIKAIKTRSGHIIELDDTKGSESITIKDMHNNLVHINTSTNDITISAGENMTLNSKNMQINVEENLDITVGKNKTEHITESHVIMAANEDKQVAEEIKVISSTYKREAQEITREVSGEVKTNAGGKITISSAETVEVAE